MSYSPAFPDYRVPFCAEDCPCRLVDLRCVIRCPCGMSEIGENCPYCVVQRPTVSRDAETREAMRAEADARLDAVRDASVLETRESFEAFQADAKGRLSQPPVKAPRKRRTKAEMAAVRAERYARADATPDTEFPKALLDENETPMEWELDDVQRDIQGALK